MALARILDKETQSLKTINDMKLGDYAVILEKEWAGMILLKTLDHVQNLAKAHCWFTKDSNVHVRILEKGEQILITV